MGVVIAEEPYAAFVDEVKALAPLHWEELALDRDDIPLDIDWDFYAAVEKVGSLAGYTVRKDGALIGYAAYFVRKHPRYRTHLFAVSDVFWVHPGHRDGKIGNALFAFIEDSLRAKGVKKMQTTFKIDHPAPGLLLRRRGHAIIEHGLSKRLN